MTDHSDSVKFQSMNRRQRNRLELYECDKGARARSQGHDSRHKRRTNVERRQARRIKRAS